MTTMRDALAQYLVAMGMAEEKPGYGHATGKDVANAVMVFLSEWEAGRRASLNSVEMPPYDEEGS